MTARGAPCPVGVVVITRNRRESLLRTLRHLARLPEKPQVVVVDNASADGTPQAVRQAHPAVRVLGLGSNRGAAARNTGAAALTTPLIAFCDDDSWWAPHALDAAAGHFARHPRLGLLAAAVRVGPDEQPDPLDSALAAAPLGRSPDLPGPSVLGFLACAAVVRREAFLDAGGFLPMLRIGGEEALLALDLAAAGWGLAYCPDVIAHHHPHPGPRTGRSALQHRNRLLTAWLRRPLPYALRATARLARDASEDPQARRALLSALLRLPDVVRHRAPLPPWVERSARLLDD
ncbi:glycosyltransferase family 2 protein [Streptacidiphilus griseoplanus]|uniref:glycosyltransferase family 2 protein n=1 Tax=Peterkaempfera griseoplana TaxID=66896 RepID=UPI0006E25F8B|nr:glycosyltransferase [Peterkaempfera griseoplana]